MINFPAVSAYDFDRSSVSFPVDVDGVRRRVLVPETVIQDVLLVQTANAQELVAYLEANRATFEDAATARIEAGEQGDIVLRLSDL